MRARVTAGLLAAWGAAAAPALAQSYNDYPTAARADYVFACMKANGETQPMLERCSCSIDVIASLLPFEQYSEAETFLRMGQLTGEAGVLFRTSEKSHAAISNLRRAQAEAEIRCFE
jgi:hypothetical protein